MTDNKLEQAPENTFSPPRADVPQDHLAQEALQVENTMQYLPPVEQSFAPADYPEVVSQQPEYLSQHPILPSYPPANHNGELKASGASITGLVLGIVSIPLSLLFLLGGWAASIIGLVFSIKGFKKKENRGVTLTGIITSSLGLLSSAVLSVISLILIIFISGLPMDFETTFDQKVEEDPTIGMEITEETEEEPATSDQDEENGKNEDWSERFIERDQFIADQKIDLSAPPFLAITDAQKQYIKLQKQHVEATGVQWNDELESLALSLTLDACETAILNGHRIDAMLLTTHIYSSPTIQGLAELDETEAEREATIETLTDAAIFGMSFLCPADYEGWQHEFMNMFY